MVMTVGLPLHIHHSFLIVSLPVHSVSLSVTSLAKFYGISKTSVTTSITLTLLFRSAGAAIFGVAGDYWGRKWPMCVAIPAFIGFVAHRVRVSVIWRLIG